MSDDFDESAHFRETMGLNRPVSSLFQPKWRPIETAPRDEERAIIVHSDTSGRSAVVCFDGLEYFVMWPIKVFADATHWMPLPDPPND